MESMLSVRGKKLLIVNGYTFRKDKNTSVGVSYRCTTRGCSASVSVDNSESVILKSNTNHNHLAKANLDTKKIQHGIKRKAIDDISERPSKIIHHAVEHGGKTLDFTTKDLENMRKSIYRARRSVLPPLPQCQQDVHDSLNAFRCSTNKGEDFLLINASASNIIIFSCKTNLKYLCSRSKIYVDGTFDYCPKFFKQLFTIHSVENGHYIPLVFILLPNKHTSTYSLALQLLSNCCKDQNLNFRPAEVVCDFEIAIQNSFKQMWPSIIIIGCRFHLTQSWYRKIQAVGLATDYQNKTSEIGLWLHWTFGLLFLNYEAVEDCFVEDLYSSMPVDKRVVTYSDYLVDNYISDSAIFSPKLWASCSSTLERTTNACESFHSLYNSMFYTPHPNIFKFVDVLKNIQINTYIKINSVHLPVTIKNCEYKKRHQYISNLIELYKNKGISRFDFVKSVCYRYSK